MWGNSYAATLVTFECTVCCHGKFFERSPTIPNLACHRLRQPCRTNLRFHAFQNVLMSRTNLKVNAVSGAEVAVLEDEEKKSWDQCKQVLSTLNFTIEEADLMLRKAFGFVNSPYWGEERNKQVPKNEVVNGLLCYLRNLGLSDDDLHKLLKKFPEVLGCDLENEIKENIGTLEKEWGIKGKSLRNLLLRNPKVLGYNVDCKGDCEAKCTRCWARF